MDTKINFDFVSPEESIVSSEVDMVQIPAVEGDAGILPNHAPYMTILRQGIVEVTFDKDNIKKYLLETIKMKVGHIARLIRYYEYQLKKIK